MDKKEEKVIKAVDLLETTKWNVLESGESWRSFLDTASVVHKYEVADQLMIYSQKPNAIACADMNTWNKHFNKYIKAGSKGIALVRYDSENKPFLRYVFDVNDTRNVEKSKDIEVWKIEDKHKIVILSQLQNTFGETDITGNFAVDVSNVVKNIVSKSSKLQDLEDVDRKLIIESTKYLLLKRLDIEVENYVDVATFGNISNYSLNEFDRISNVTTALNRTILEEIEKDVINFDKNVDKSNYIVYDKVEKVYKKIESLKNEEDINYGQNGDELRKSGGLSTSETGFRSGGLHTGQIRNDESELLEETRSRASEPFETEISMVESPGGSGQEDPRDDRGMGGTSDGSRESNGRDESQRPSDVDRTSEQSDTIGRGSNPTRDDIQLNFAYTNETIIENNGIKQLIALPSVEQQVNNIINAKAEEITDNSSAFLVAENIDNTVSDEVVAKILSIENSKDDYNKLVSGHFATTQDVKLNASYLQELCSMGNKGFIVDGEKYSVYVDEINGIKIAKGNSVEFNENTTDISWEKASEIIRKSLENGTFANKEELENSVEYYIKNDAEQLQDYYLLSTLGKHDDIKDIFKNKMKSMLDVIDNEPIEFKAIDNLERVNKQFITGDMLDEKLKSSIYTKEIYSIFKLAINQENRVKGLKNAYEKGNVYGKANISEKGIEFLEDFDKVFLSWEQVEKSIGKLIENDRYLDENDKKIADRIVEKHTHKLRGKQTEQKQQLEQQQEEEQVQQDEVEEIQKEEQNSVEDNEINSLYEITLEIKEEKSENIVFVKNNEFYEVYGSDAEVLKAEFDYTVLSKNVGLDNKVGMVGIPSNSLSDVLKELTNKNYNVSVADGDTQSHYLANNKVHSSLEKMIADEECINDFLSKKVEYPNHLIGLNTDNVILFYGEDSEVISNLLGKNIILGDLPTIGNTKVTGVPVGELENLRNILNEKGYNFMVAEKKQVQEYNLPVIEEKEVAEVEEAKIEELAEVEETKIEEVAEVEEPKIEEEPEVEESKIEEEAEDSVIDDILENQDNEDDFKIDIKKYDIDNKGQILDDIANSIEKLKLYLGNIKAKVTNFIQDVVSDKKDIISDDLQSDIEEFKKDVEDFNLDNVQDKMINDDIENLEILKDEIEYTFAEIKKLENILEELENTVNALQNTEIIEDIEETVEKTVEKKIDTPVRKIMYSDFASEFVQNRADFTDREMYLFTNEQGKEYVFGMGDLGNGTNVWNYFDEESNDYRTVAHISEDGFLKVYDNEMPQQAIEYLENHANKINYKINEDLEMNQEDIQAVEEVSENIIEKTSEQQGKIDDIDTENETKHINNIEHRNYMQFAELFPDIIDNKYEYMMYNSELFNELAVENVPRNVIILSNSYEDDEGYIIIESQLTLEVDFENKTLIPMDYQFDNTYLQTTIFENGTISELNIFLRDRLKEIADEKLDLLETRDRNQDSINLDLEEKQEEPIVAESKKKFRNTYEHRNYKAFEKQFSEILENKYSYMKFEGEPYQPLHIEKLDDVTIAMSHTYIQNGDLMRDPEITFKVDFENQEFIPLTFQNDGLGMYQEVFQGDEYSPKLFKDLNSYLNDWLKNISVQERELVDAYNINNSIADLSDYEKEKITEKVEVIEDTEITEEVEVVEDVEITEEVEVIEDVEITEEIEIVEDVEITNDFENMEYYENNQEFENINISDAELSNILENTINAEVDADTYVEKTEVEVPKYEQKEDIKTDEQETYLSDEEYFAQIEDELKVEQELDNSETTERYTVEENLEKTDFWVRDNEKNIIVSSHDTLEKAEESSNKANNFLKMSDYIGTVIEYEGKDFRIDKIDFDYNRVNLFDLEMSNFLPISRAITCGELYEVLQDKIEEKVEIIVENTIEEIEEINEINEVEEIEEASETLSIHTRIDEIKERLENIANMDLENASSRRLEVLESTEIKLSEELKELENLVEKSEFIKENTVEEFDGIEVEEDSEILNIHTRIDEIKERLENIANMDLENASSRRLDILESTEIKLLKELKELENLVEKSELRTENNIDELEEVDIVEDVDVNNEEIQEESVTEQEQQQELPNFRITDEHLGEWSTREKAQKNIEAIQILKQLEKEDRPATADEQLKMSQYVGWGGIQEIFEEKEKSWAKEYHILQDLLTPQEYKSARGTTTSAFYTPPVVIKSIYDAIENMGIHSNSKIIDPSSGVGNFLGMLPDKFENAKLTGVEIDSISGRLAKKIYPQADIQIKGFEKTNFQDSSFDVFVGNVPYSNCSIPDKAYKKDFLVHDYFFAKALDKVKEGGIVAFLTSSGTLDKNTNDLRKMLAEKSELLGAIRLPDNTFDKNANTTVVSDIIFLQKRENPIEITEERLDNDPSLSWVKVGNYNHVESGEQYPLNNYFLENPDMILGNVGATSSQHGMKLSFKDDFKSTLDEKLQIAIKNLKGVNKELIEKLPFINNEREIADTSKELSDEEQSLYKNFSYTVIDDKVFYRENDLLNEVDTNKTAIERIKMMVEIRDVTREILDMQVEGCSNEQLEQKQAELNTSYDKYHKKFGTISSMGSSRAFRDDSSYPLLRSLENIDDEGNLSSKTAIFYKRTIREVEDVTSVETPSEALIVSLGERSRVDIDYMAELLNRDDKTHEEKIDEIINSLNGTAIFKEPTSFNNGKTIGWKTADEYLSGNIREKLEVAKSIAETDNFYNINVETLEKAMPTPLIASEIDVRIGSTWIDPKYYEQFMHELFETPNYLKSDIQVSYSPLTSNWNISKKNSDLSNPKVNNVYGTKRINAYSLMEDTLNLKIPIVKDRVVDGDSVTYVTNSDETSLAQTKQEELENQFSNWIFADAERRADLVETYNEIYNSVKPREFDGSYLNFKGMNPEITLRQHQKNAISRCLMGGNSMLAHVVGAGKTYTMIASALEGKRLGLHNKSMMIVPNHLTEQMGADAYKLYPNAKVLVATKKDFEPKRRKEFCSRIATGDYDLVILGHSQFEKIPVSPQREQDFIEQEVDKIQEALREAKANKGERFTIKQLELTKKKLSTKLEKLAEAKQKDDVVTFEQLGVDKLFVDEAHNFKNSFIQTKMTNVAGIGQTAAQKSIDLLMKCRYLDEITDFKGVTFATGTPISNSMSELYTMMNYLQKDTLDKYGLGHFDNWAANFGKCISEMELRPEGTGFRMKTRFSKFFNLPELIKLWKNNADVQTADMLNLPTPKVEHITVVTKPSNIQKDMVKDLGERAERIRKEKIDPKIDNLLKITSEGRKLALDQRIMNPMLPDDPNSKVNEAVKNMHNIWEETSEQKSTQVIFCDLSTPKGSSSNKEAKGEDVTIDDNNDREMEEVGYENFTVYEDIKEKLINKGVPPKEIAFIHDANTDQQKATLFTKVRNGEIRFLLGSTEKCGAGTNIQDKLVALHHLDCPWKPSSIQQREGRIVRQGNANKEVKIFKYVTEDTFDAFNWAIIERKLKFIGQVFTSKSPSRSAEDIDSSALSAAEIKALATGDPRIKEVMELTVEVNKLKVSKNSFLGRKYEMEDNINKNYPEKIERLTENISKLTNDIKTVNANYITTDNFKMEIKGNTYTKRADAGKVVLNEVKKLGDSNEAVDLGKFMGIDMELQRKGFEYVVTFKGEINHTVGLEDKELGNITRMTNCLENIADKLQSNKENLESVENNLKIALEEVGKPFTKEEEYTSKSARLSELTKELEEEEKTGGIQKRENLDSEDIDLADGSYSLKGLLDIKNQLKESSNQGEQEQGALLEDEEVGKKLTKCEEI